MVLTDHISKEMNELNLIRCKKIPKRPGADWRDLPDEKVTLRDRAYIYLQSNLLVMCACFTQI